MKVLGYISLLVGFWAMWGCTEIPDIDEQKESRYVIQGFLISGETVRNFQVFQLQANGNLVRKGGLNIQIHGPLGSFGLNETSPGVYGNIEESILAQADYVVSINDGKRTISGDVNTPPLFDWSSPLPEQINIVESSPFSQVLNLDWTEEGDVEYILRLTEPDDAPLEIDFVGSEGGNFATVYANPQPESGTVVLASDFNYYGNHQLTVFAVNKGYADLYNPSLILESEDIPFIEEQFEGGYGFVAGLTPIKFNFLVD